MAPSVDDLLGLGTPSPTGPPVPQSFPNSGSPLPFGGPVTPPADTPSEIETSISTVSLDENNTGEVLWCEMFPANPESVVRTELQQALSRQCKEPLLDLFRRDRVQEAAVAAIADTCIPDCRADCLVRDDFTALIKEVMTGRALPLLEKAMEEHRKNESLDTLLWLLMARLTAERLCLQH